MSRKDYVLIADSLALAYMGKNEDTIGQFSLVVDKMVNSLSADNERFDSSKFREYIFEKVKQFHGLEK